MTALTLVLGNKNYSSWSLRAWLALEATGAAFDEIVIPLWLDGAKEQILAHSPSGKVPALRHGDLVVWESLAICEHLAEAFPDAELWPADPAARAAARSASHEMHAGFMALRRAMPMNCRASKPGRGMADGVAADIERVGAIWRDCRERFGAGGALLFGGFTIADAMFAPIASRFRTYGVALDPVSAAYVQAVHALPAMRSWIAAAEAEPQTVDQFEI
jgi:glutathione S-transferase